MALLGHRAEANAVGERIRRLSSQGIPQLLATEGDEVLGLCGLHQMTAIHREQPVGRITILVVAENARGRGFGKALVDAAVAHFRQTGCRLVEVTSNLQLADAHGFYQHLGFTWTSKRLALSLA